jgi:glycosyltransferase involved in cell wall biosynthesis
MREKLSAFVIAYNRASLLETCLRAASFADELIVVDKSSTDESAAVAARYADRVEIVPWSPTVEETRAFALSLCRHEWILFLDDDEILSAETGPYSRNLLDNPDAEIFAIPLRHYVLGVHDERAYYWPEAHHRLFRKGAVEFVPTVHGGVALQTERTASIPADSGVCIHHLSYRDVASWIERTNRYTDRPDRVQVEGGTGNLIQFAHDRIDDWMRRTTDSSADDYPAAVALLRGIYDMVDRLKAWERERGLDGAELFRIAQQNLVPAQEDRQAQDGAADKDRHAWCRSRTGGTPHFDAEYFDETRLAPAADVSTPAALPNDHMAMQAILVQLRAAEAHLRERVAAERRASVSLRSTRHELGVTVAALAGTRNDLAEARAAFDQTREILGRTQEERDQTKRTLDQTLSELDQTRDRLDQTAARLAYVGLQAERLSNSARLFIRQYWPKLRRHLSHRPGFRPRD